MKKNGNAMKALVFLGVLAAVGAQAQNATQQEIVVTASRDRSAASKTPANISVITSDDIQRNANVSIADALRGLEGVEVRSFSGNASQAEVSMRGFGDNGHGRVLILLDGRRLNRPDMSGINWLEIPVNSVERIEVIRGSSSALYGDYAVGGVIHIITKKGAPKPETRVSAQTGSYGTFVERAGTSGAKGPWTYSVNAEHQQTAGYRDRSAYRGWGGSASLGRDFGENVHAGLSVSYDRVDFEMPGYLTRTQMEQDRTQSLNPDDSAESEFLNVGVGLRAGLGGAGRVEADIGYAVKAMQSDVTSWTSYSDMRIGTLSLTPRYILDRTVMGRGNKLIAGVDLYRDALDVDRFFDATHGAETSSAEIRKETLGLYARDELDLSDAWRVAVGGRLETASIDAEMAAAAGTGPEGDRTHHASAAEVMILRSFGEAAKVFAKAGTVFRFPFLDEQVSYIGYGTDRLYADLDAEKGISCEVGANAGVTESLRLGLTLFRLEMEDEIAWNAVTMRNENTDETRRQGAEASATWKAGKAITVDAGYTYTDAGFSGGVNTGKDVPLVPKHQASASVDCLLPWDFSARGAVRYVGERPLGADQANLGPKLGDYTVVDILARYEPATRCKGLEVIVGVENVFNEKYSSVGYVGMIGDAMTDVYYPSPERAFKAGLSYRF